MRSSFCLVFPLLILAILEGCSNGNQFPDVTDNIRKSLDQAGYKDIRVRQDRERGVITLTGAALTESDKAQAEAIAKSSAGSEVVANQVAVRPPGIESEARAVDADLDKAIEKNLEAELIKNRLKKEVKYDVKNGVVTLSGEVASQSRRDEVDRLAAAVPNVKQIVNELAVRNQMVTSTKKGKPR